MHVIVNRVSPEDGRMAKIDPPKFRALDCLANEYEKARGAVVSSERVAEKQRQYPDPEAQRAHVVEKAIGRARAAQKRQEDASEHPTLSGARKAAQGLSATPEFCSDPAGDQRGDEGAAPVGMGGATRR